MRKHSKRVKKLIRQWKMKAHENELHRELTRLDESMAAWRRGDMSSGEMSHRIHEWETGPSRALFKWYNYGSPGMAVAYAIVLGILDEQQVPAELLDALSITIDHFRSMQEQDELRDREGEWWVD
jgi:hypothetical protein